MQEYAQSFTVESLADAVQAMLDASPAGLPPEWRDSLEQAVRRSRGRIPPHLFYATVEQAPVAISITDPDANILYVNPAFERVTGYGRSEVVGSNESLLSDKCTPVHIYQDLWRHLLAQQVWSGTLVNRSKSGVRYVAELVIAPVVDEGGVTRHYLGIHRDITEFHRLEREALNQRQRVESTIDLAPMAIALVDLAGDVVLENRAYQRLKNEMGVEPRELLAHHLGMRAPGDGSAFHDEEVSFEPGEDRPTRWFSCSGTWIREMDDRAGAFFAPESRRHLLLVMQEITRIKQQQEEVRRNALRALIAEEARVHGLRESIAAAGFQLLGPFNMLKAALGILERRGNEEQNAPVIDVLRQALAAGQQALEVLRTAMPNEQPEAPVRVNVNQALRDVLSLLTDRMLALGVEVEWRPAPQLPAAWGCENRLRAMFKQLLDNALDAMDAPVVRRRELRVVTTVSDDAVRISIEDSGPGIPDELRIRVFEPSSPPRRRAPMRAWVSPW